MISLAVVAILLFLGGIGVSVYRIVRYGVRQFSDVLQSPLLIAICLFGIVVIASMLICSRYSVDDTHYGTQFGFIKTKSPIKEITAMELNTDTHKLTIYVGENYSVYTLSKEWQDDFIASLRKVNPNIDFTFTLAETNGNKKK